MKQHIQLLIQILGSLLCFWWLFRQISLEQLIGSFSRSSYFAIMVIGIIMIPAILARAWRWYYILARQGIQVSLASITQATFIGMALNLLLPASAGDVARSYFGWQKYGHKEEMLATTLADKAVALLSLFLLGAAGGLFCGDGRLALMAMALSIPTGLILVFPARWVWTVLAQVAKRLLGKEFDVDLLVRNFHMSFSTFMGALAISIAGWMVTNLMYFLSVRSVGGDVGMGYIFAISPLVNVVRMLPISISGLGSADALMVELLSGVGVDNHLTLAASMIVNLTLIVLPGAIGAGLMLVNAGALKRSGVS